MDKRDDVLARMRQGAFRRNNGQVLRTVNILRGRYVKLLDCMYALDRMAEADFLDCLNYLFRAGYIDLRTVGGHTTANLADHELAELEAALSAEGIRLTEGTITDDAVEV